MSVMNDYKSCCFKGDLPSPSTQSDVQSGTANNLTEKLVHSSWTLNRWGQQTAVDSIKIHSWRMPIILVFCPLSPHLSGMFPLLVFPFVLLTQTVALGLLCGFIGCWFSVLWDVSSQTLELLTCFFHFSPSLSLPPCSFPPQENQGKLTSSRTGEIELYYFSFGSLTLLPLSESYHFLHLLARVLIDQWPLNAYADQ